MIKYQVHMASSYDITHPATCLLPVPHFLVYKPKNTSFLRWVPKKKHVLVILQAFRWVQALINLEELHGCRCQGADPPPLGSTTCSDKT